MQSFTCDMCGEGISIYGVGYVTDRSLVTINVTVLDRESGSVDVYHLHHKCYGELIDFIKPEEE